MKKCIAVFGAALVIALLAAAQDWPRYETFLGYTYVRANSATNIPAFNANGGSGQFVFDFNKWFGGVVDLGAVHNGDIHNIHLDTTVANFLAGPRFAMRNRSRFTPYIQALFGGAYGTTSIPVSAAPLVTGVGDADAIPRGASLRFVRQQADFAMTAGGGLDIRITHHVTFRPFQVEYFLTHLHNYRTLSDDSQNNLRCSTGFDFTWGGEEPTPAPQPPVTKTCPDGSTVPAGAVCPKHNLTLSLGANPTELCPGDVAQVNAAVTGGGKNQLNFHWTVNGQPVSQEPSFVFGSAGREPGAYRVGLSVDGASFNPASAETMITIREYRPPTGTAQANPAEIYAGEKSALTASCQGDCGGPIQTPTFTASEGSVQGDQFDSTGVQFDPTNKAEQRKTVTITARCSDNRSAGTATTTVTVIKKAEIAAIRLPDVLFSDNNARVNNCGKRILLEELRGYFEKDPSGTVVLVGHSSDDETAANLDMQRALNSAAVITAGTGVCLSIPQSQVLVNATGTNQNGVSFEPGLCGTSVSGGASGMRRVEVWFIPAGGQPPSYQNASTLPVSGLGCPK